VVALQKVLGKYGLGGLEIWNTEASWGATVSADQDQEASWLMRFHMALAATGVSRFVWYAYDNGNFGTLWGPDVNSPSDSVQGLRPAGIAYGVIEKWLVGATIQQCQQYKNGLWICQLVQPDGSNQWMVWSTGANMLVPIPSTLGLTTLHDWQDNLSSLGDEITAGQMPVLLE
jgi:hypothetical protein